MTHNEQNSEQFSHSIWNEFIFIIVYSLRNIFWIYKKKHQSVSLKHKLLSNKQSYLETI